MSMAITGAAVVFFSLLAFLRMDKGSLSSGVLFMLVAGVSIMVGLQWYDVYTTSTGLGISLMLIAYSLVCVGFAFRCIFWKGNRDEE